jgi:energy-coupling factor transport system ATP-binding protein
LTDAVVFERVTFEYPGAAHAVLDDVSLRLPEGSFVLATGPTGGGKSTLLRAINGLVPHFSGGRFSGRVLTASRDTRMFKPRDMADAVAFVPQDPAASFVLDRVEDELAYGMENLGTPVAHMRRRIEEAVDLLGIDSLRRRSVRALSGGERQRVAIAAALAAGPRVLVLDEPTSQLDPQGAEDVLAALARLVHDLGMTVVAAEHRLERIASFADVVVGCLPGRVIVGRPAEVFDRLASGPPVTVVGRALGWSPAPLSVRDARRHAAATSLRRSQEARPAAGPPVLRARSVAAGYDGTEVLTGVDLVLGAGERVALMGRNGSGKTTLLRLLAGVLPPSRGSVRTAVGPPRTGVDVALCPQEPESVLFCSTVAEEISSTVAGRPDVDPRRFIREFGLADAADVHPRDLSAGRRLLVAAAAMVATGAPVLLLDEPTRGLDPEAKAALTGFLAGFAARGGTSMFATHDVELAAAAASRVVMLAGGEVIADGAPEDVLGDSAVFAPQMTRVFGAGWLTPSQVIAAASS